MKSVVGALHWFTSSVEAGSAQTKANASDGEMLSLAIVRQIHF
jgi:hypothetical protein